MTTVLVVALVAAYLAFLVAAFRRRDEMRRTHKPAHLAERVGIDLDAADRRAHGWEDRPPPPPYQPSNLWTPLD